MDICITNNIKSEDEATVLQGLYAYNQSKLEVKKQKDLGVYFKDAQDEIQAGLLGKTFGNWLMIKYLWVNSSLRGQKVGSQLLKSAEEEARRRGCKYVCLDTFDFQAPKFYEKYGYKEIYVLEDYPLTGKRFYYTKEL